MKVPLKYLLVTAVALMLGQSAFASSTDIVAMSVTITTTLSVNVTEATLGLGSLATGGSAVSSAATVTNDGSTTEIYQLALTGMPAAWSVYSGAGAPPYNQIKVQGLFCSKTALTGDFNDTDDIITGSNQSATSTKYAIDAEDETITSGTGCTIGAVRKLWFQFYAPSGSSVVGQQYVSVTVTAIQG